MRISNRLRLVADMIDKHKQGTCLADIGSDHAQLPCYLIINDILEHVFACDIADGPHHNSLETIQQYNLFDSVTALLGDGLNPILDKKVDMISICGMGGYLITDILEENKKYLRNIKIMFLQANNNVDHLRKYLFKNSFKIIDEALVKDSDFIYEVIVVIKDNNNDAIYSKADIEFGPILSNQRSSIFKEKWDRQYKEYNNIMKDLDKNHPRYHEIDLMMKMIEEYIYDC